MWDVLKPADIDEAQQQLNERRAALLVRQAEELARLQADEADLEALDRLAAAFSSKFAKATAPAAPVIPVSHKSDHKSDLPPIQHQAVSPRPHPRPSHAEKGSLSGTNFEVFSRAVSKSGF
jgi:hypothetical protein